MSINTLLSPMMMLCAAMRDVMDGTPPDAAPFAIVVELELPPMCRMMQLDVFNAEVLRPAINGAAPMDLPDPVEFRKRGDGAREVFAGDVEMGILGRLVEYYRLDADRDMARIDIRVLNPALCVEDVP